MYDSFLTPCELYEVRTLPAPEVRLDIEGVWQLERHAWFVASVDRDRWVAFAHTQTPNRREALALFNEQVETIGAVIGLLGVRWAEAETSPTTVAGLQRLCRQTMTPDVTRALSWMNIFDGEAIRDAIQADIDAGVPTAFTYLTPPSPI